MCVVCNVSVSALCGYVQCVGVVCVSLFVVVVVCSCVCVVVCRTHASLFLLFDLLQWFHVFFCLNTFRDFKHY